MDFVHNFPPRIFIQQTQFCNDRSDRSVAPSHRTMGIANQYHHCAIPISWSPAYALRSECHGGGSSPKQVTLVMGLIFRCRDDLIMIFILNMFIFEKLYRDLMHRVFLHGAPSPGTTFFIIVFMLYIYIQKSCTVTQFIVCFFTS